MPDAQLLTRLYRGELPSAELPNRLDISSMAEDMNRLWQRSIAEIDRGQVIEWGAVLVVDSEGALQLKNAVAGTSGDVAIAVELSSGETLAGTFHTHPYEDGTTGMPFSGTDIASALASGENLSIVQSGDEVFALIRTEKTQSLEELAALIEEFNSAYTSYFNAGLSEQDAGIAANLDMCAKYGLAFYRGHASGELRKVYGP
ncbi:MAG: hypothetical protein ACE5LU_02130 [Anaerolineae bacterium]